jgi:adenylate cyclase
MGIEIERKFLVKNDSWRAVADAGQECRQGYLVAEKGKSVRVRIMGEKAFLTIKGETQGITRSEFEYEIPPADAEALLQLCGGAVLEKRRHIVHYGGMDWEVDVFGGTHLGLVLAEIELEEEGQVFEWPDWLGEEVSSNPRYFNAVLARQLST